MLSQRARELIERQRLKYLQTLPQKKRRISACWRDLQIKGWRREQFDRLKTEIHRLTGSAGSYGLDDLGVAAMELDRLLSKTCRSAEHLRSVGRQVEVLEKELDRASSDTP